MAPATQQPTRLADRYGARRRRWPRWVPALIGVGVVLAGVGVAYLGYLRFGPQDINGQQVSYDAVNDSTMTIKFTVTRKDPSRAADCIVVAKSKDGDEAGRREVYIAPSSSGTVVVETPIRTSKPPAAGDVYGCSFDVPGYLTRT
ncbi:DUF4307 domain-containing protein [Skermania sp. ID1734]|uniref:DUF4307 domain-containing protein n=1 Tax=Skermania sp. ID1734 TaxID=2597516 RepID=UPI00118002B5|nr:DUF4307 domain-containing protein [Skermania sp. ID1734]TSE01997.1 DUF4307 domain-containing protein [Skermania sp. ID1734]